VDDLIEGLTILRKYASPAFPTNCEHDVLFVNVAPGLVSAEDRQRLDELGFFPSEDFGFQSFRFGSC
jgi:hypothetical protein